MEEQSLARSNLWLPDMGHKKGKTTNKEARQKIKTKIQETRRSKSEINDNLTMYQRFSRKNTRSIEETQQVH